ETRSTIATPVVARTTPGTRSARATDAARAERAAAPAAETVASEATAAPAAAGPPQAVRGTTSTAFTGSSAFGLRWLARAIAATVVWKRSAIPESVSPGWTW